MNSPDTLEGITTESITTVPLDELPCDKLDMYHRVSPCIDYFSNHKPSPLPSPSGVPHKKLKHLTRPVNEVLMNF